MVKTDAYKEGIIHRMCFPRALIKVEMWVFFLINYGTIRKGKSNTYLKVKTHNV